MDFLSSVSICQSGVCGWARSTFAFLGRYVRGCDSPHELEPETERRLQWNLEGQPKYPWGRGGLRRRKKGRTGSEPRPHPTWPPSPGSIYTAWVFLNNVQRTPVGFTLEKPKGDPLPSCPPQSLSLPLQRRCCSCFPLSEGPSLILRDSRPTPPALANAVLSQGLGVEESATNCASGSLSSRFTKIQPQNLLETAEPLM